MGRSFSVANAVNNEGTEQKWEPTKFQVKVNTVTLKTEKELLEEKVAQINAQKLPVAFFNDAVEKIENPTVSARRWNIRYSAHKLGCVANVIAGQHIYDAESMISQVDKKGAKFIGNALRNAKSVAERRGLATERLFVKTITVGKALSHKKIDIKGRGKHGVIKVPKSNLRLVLEERGLEDFYKMILKGEASPGLALFFRMVLYQNSSNFAQVKALSHLTTSDGRHYRRTQFKRLVQKITKDYAKEGKVMRQSKIERNLLEKEAQNFVNMLEMQREQSLVTR